MDKKLRPTLRLGLSNTSLGLLSSLALIGTCFAFASPRLRYFHDNGREFETVESYGQDTNGDGVATTEEGAFDIDGDGVFGATEAEALGMHNWIKWPPRELDLASLRAMLPTGTCTHFYVCTTDGGCAGTSNNWCVDVNGDGTCDWTGPCPF